MKIGSAVRPGRVPEKRTGQDRTGKTGQVSQKKKSQSGIFRLYGEKPLLYRLEPNLHGG